MKVMKKKWELGETPFRKVTVSNSYFNDGENPSPVVEWDPTIRKFLTECDGGMVRELTIPMVVKTVAVSWNGEIECEPAEGTPEFAAWQHGFFAFLRKKGRKGKKMVTDAYGRKLQELEDGHDAGIMRRTNIVFIQKNGFHFLYDLCHFRDWSHTPYMWWMADDADPQEIEAAFREAFPKP